MTRRMIECPIDEMNRPCGSKDAPLPIKPAVPEAGRLSTGRGGEPATCRKYAPTARNCTAAHLMFQVRLRASAACGGRPGRHQVTPEPVRQTPPRQGRPRFGAAQADGAPDQQRGPDAAVVRPGRLGPVCTECGKHPRTLQRRSQQ